MNASNGLRTAGYAQLAIDVAGMFLDCVERDHQFAGDLWVGIPGADQAHDVQFAWSQRV